MKLLGTIERYEWGNKVLEEETLGEIQPPFFLKCTHCDKEFPTHLLYVLEDGQTLARPCLNEAIGEWAIPMIQSGITLRLLEPDHVAINSVLSDETERVIDHILSLDDRTDLTPEQSSWVLLARFPTIRREDCHRLFDMWGHWLTHSGDTKPNNPLGNHLGSVGDRLELNVIVSRIHGPYPGEFGDSYLCVMETDSHDQVLWWTGENLGFDEGKSYRIKGTVKKHDERDGVKQTHVQRVKEIK